MLFTRIDIHYDLIDIWEDKFIPVSILSRVLPDEKEKERYAVDLSMMITKMIFIMLQTMPELTMHTHRQFCGRPLRTNSFPVEEDWTKRRGEMINSRYCIDSY